MKKLSLHFLASLLLLVGCAEKPVWFSTEGLVAIDRDELRELHEAFKTSSQKTITLEKMKQEVECDGHACPVSVEAKARYRKKDDSVTEKNVTASLVFGREDAQKILELLEKARYERKEMSLEGNRGSVRCEKTECRIKFSLSRELRGYSRETLP